MSFALSRSERRDRAEDWRAFDYDQTHVLTAALSYDLGDEWEVGATFRLTSGVPYTPIVGAAYDAGSDRVFVSTGNGKFDAANFNWGDSVLALAHDGTGAGGGLPRDSYTPDTYQHLDDADIDLGSVALAIMPVPAGSAVAHVGVQAGKDGMLSVIDLDDMSGQHGAGHVGGEVQLLAVPADSHRTVENHEQRLQRTVRL